VLESGALGDTGTTVRGSVEGLSGEQSFTGAEGHFMLSWLDNWRWKSSPRGWLHSFLILSVLLLGPASTRAEDIDNGTNETGEDTTAAVAPIKYLLISSFGCVFPNCQVGNAVLRYNGTTGQYQGVHISGVTGAHGLAMHPLLETLWVVSRGLHRVDEYNAITGAFIRNVIPANTAGLDNPQAIMFKGDGNVLVSSSGAFNGFNGLMEFNGLTGEFVGAFVDGGLLDGPENCSDTRCLKAANAMTFGPNGRLYVTSSANNIILEYNGVTGDYVNFIDSTELISPTGIVARPGTGFRPGNLLVGSFFPNATLNDGTVLEFDDQTRELIPESSGIFLNVALRVGPLAWADNGNLLIGELLGNQAANLGDRISRRDAMNAAFLGVATAAGDNKTHQMTSFLYVGSGNALADADGDGDVDLSDASKFQACFGQNPAASCRTAFDDNISGAIGITDFQNFAQRFAGPRIVCSSAAQCNDLNACTTDTCQSQVCVHTPVTNGVSCTDGQFCDGTETCQNGLCQGIPPCKSLAHCVESTDTCLNCIAAAECNDNKICTTDTCSSGQCFNTNNTLPCEDGNACTVNDTCAAGACASGSPRVCNDGKICTTDSCDTGVGCLFINNILPCDDNSVCTDGDQCLLGLCRPGVPIDCEDEDPCTIDTCSATLGCQHTGNQGGACDDEDPCTLNDVCDEGICEGTPVPCDDQIACTVDSCVGGACQHTPNHAVCIDGAFCNGQEFCDQNLGCQPGSNPCPGQSCNETTNMCVP